MTELEILENLHEALELDASHLFWVEVERFSQIEVGDYVFYGFFLDLFLIETYLVEELLMRILFKVVN